MGLLTTIRVNSTSFVISLILNLAGGLVFNKFTQVMIILAIAVPYSIIIIYKTAFYGEDNMFIFSSLGILLVVLTLSLLILTLLASDERLRKYYLRLQLLLRIILLLCFTTNNLLLFYVLFESCLIPILLIIIGWGYQPERLQAGLYIVIYTVIRSLPLLVVIFVIKTHFGTFHLLRLFLFSNKRAIILLFGVGAFLVKLPIYGVHVWLPKAHVEAPLGGSIVLAGVLLKLGGYGLYLYNRLYSLNWNRPIGLFIIIISLWGGVLASVVCLNQVDIKALIAYSSVVHISFITLGVLSNTSWGLSSAIIIIIAHGWASSALFLVAFITYQFVGRRSFRYSKGLLVGLPLVSLIWFRLCLINIGFPPTINFLGEVLMVPVSLFFRWKVFMPVGIIIFMRVVYNIFLYRQINHGRLSNYISRIRVLTRRNILAISGHLIPLLLVFNITFVI